MLDGLWERGGATLLGTNSQALLSKHSAKK